MMPKSDPVLRQEIEGLSATVAQQKAENAELREALRELSGACLDFDLDDPHLHCRICGQDSQGGALNHLANCQAAKAMNLLGLFYPPKARAALGEG